MPGEKGQREDMDTDGTLDNHENMTIAPLQSEEIGETRERGIGPIREIGEHGGYNMQYIQPCIKQYLRHHWTRFPCIHKNVLVDTLKETTQGKHTYWLHALVACASIYQPNITGMENIGLESATKSAQTFPPPINLKDKEPILYVQACLHLAWFWSNQPNDSNGKRYLSMATGVLPDLITPSFGVWHTTAMATWWTTVLMERLLCPLYGVTPAIPPAEGKRIPLPSMDCMLHPIPLPLSSNVFTETCLYPDNYACIQLNIAQMMADVVALRRRLSCCPWTCGDAVLDDEHDQVLELHGGIRTWMDSLPLVIKTAGDVLWSSQLDGYRAPIRFVSHSPLQWWKPLDRDEKCFSHHVANVYIMLNAALVALHSPTVSRAFGNQDAHLEKWIASDSFIVSINHIVALCHFCELRLCIGGFLDGLGQDVVPLLDVATEVMGRVAVLVKNQKIDEREGFLCQVFGPNLYTARDLIERIMSRQKVLASVLKRMASTSNLASSVYDGLMTWRNE